MNGVNISQCRKVAFEQPIVTEKTVMSWAAEHPVVYPTWSEWLYSVGVLMDKELPLPTVDDGSAKIICNNIATDRVNDPIPADIAQKLGIEPKEG